MKTQTEALKLALKKAFQLGQRYWALADSEYSSHWKKADKAQADFEQLVEDTLKEALAQPEQEPVAWMQTDEVHISLWKDDYHTIPLYTTPPQRTWVGLTDEEIMDMYNEPRSDAEMIAFGREVEAKLKEKNNEKGG